MARLDDLCLAVKSANAGATWLTFDLVFPDAATYDAVRRSGALCADLFGRLYRVDPIDVAVYHCDQILTVKATVPRRTLSGGADETDFDGTQQFAPLLDVEIQIDGDSPARR